MRIKTICPILFSCMALFVLLSPLSAQDSPRYHLRELTASDYIHGVLDEVLPPDYYCIFELNQSCLLPNLLLIDALRYPGFADVDYATLKDAYRRLVYNSGASRFVIQDWTEQVILAWLRETHADLRATSRFAMGGFVVGVTPFDADGDGKSEWVLDVNTGSRGFSGLLVLQQDEKGVYSFIPSPLPTDRPCCFTDFDMHSWRSLSLIQATDVNGDGQDELVAFTSASSRYDSDNYGQVYVLGLRDGAMVDLMAEPLSYREPASLRERALEPGFQTYFRSWQFSVKSGKVELIEITRQDDNFDCVTYQTAHYEWRADRFSLASTEAPRYTNSMGCTMRKGQEALWAGDFEASVDLFDQMLALPLDTTVPARIVSEYPNRRAYAWIRSGLAHGLSGDLKAATDDFHAALQETDDPQFTALANVLLAATDTPFDLCKQTYDYFLNEYQQGSYWPSFVNALYEPAGGSYPPPSPSPDPAKAGCDVGSFADHAISQLQITADQRPSEALERAEIQTAADFTSDLNADGVPDWVVWVAEDVDAFVFISAPDNTYQVTRSAIPMPSQTVTVFAQALPDHSGNALVAIDPHPDSNSLIHFESYYCEQYAGAGSLPLLTLWRLKQGVMVDDLQAPVCDLHYTLESLFPADGTLHAGARLFSNRGFETATYTWDATSKRFRAPEMTTVVTDDVFLGGQPDANMRLYGGGTFIGDLPEKSPSDLLIIIDAWITKHPEDQAAEYERALVLEMMGYKDRALAAYVDLYSHFQGNAYGELAGLHLQPGE